MNSESGLDSLHRSNCTSYRPRASSRCLINAMLTPKGPRYQSAKSSVVHTLQSLAQGSAAVLVVDGMCPGMTEAIGIDVAPADTSSPVEDH